MPQPHKDEQKKDYLDRCMGDDEMNKKHPAPAERYAVCNSFWNNKDKK